MWSYEGYGKKYLNNTNSMKNSFTYYDANRAANPVRQLSYVAASANCAAGWESLNNLYRWPGSVDGCWESAKAHHGACHSKSGKNAAAV